MTVMVIKRGMPKVRLGPRGATKEGIPTDPARLDFTPFDMDTSGGNTVGGRIGGIKLSEKIWKELISGKNVYAQFKTFPKALAWFQANGYKFACPFTGRQFADLADYQKYADELKEMVSEAG